jgi:ribose 5-phosphate isomerase A
MFFFGLLSPLIKFRPYSRVGYFIKAPTQRYLHTHHTHTSKMPSPAELVELSKKLCAYAAVDNNLKASHKIIGIGSGSTVVYVAERIGQLPNKKDLVCIPTGFQSKQLIIDNGLQLGGLEEFSTIDIAFDGADEIDTSLNCIKGGGACLLQEKLVADSSKEFILVADDRKNTGVLGKGWKKGVPIEVVPNAYNKIIKELTALGGTPAVRPGAPAKAGPVITDNGNFIIDCDFGEIEVSKVEALNSKIKAMVGVVETGLFVNMAQKAYIGNADGTVTTLNI